MRKIGKFTFFWIFLAEMLQISIVYFTFAPAFEKNGARTCSSVG